MKLRTTVKPKLNWQTIWSLYAEISVRGQTLGLSILSARESEWAVICVETPSRRTGERGFAMLQRTLEDHSHDTLGPFETEEAAREAAQGYAADWKRGRGRRAARCGCEAIQPEAVA